MKIKSTAGNILERMARYAGLLLALAKGFGFLPRFCLPFAPKGPYVFIGQFLYPVITLVTDLDIHSKSSRTALLLSNIGIIVLH